MDNFHGMSNLILHLNCFFIQLIFLNIFFQLKKSYEFFFQINARAALKWSVNIYTISKPINQHCGNS